MNEFLLTVILFASAPAGPAQWHLTYELPSMEACQSAGDLIAQQFREAAWQGIQKEAVFICLKKQR